LHRIQWRSGGKTIIHMADAPAHGSQFGGPGHEEQGPKLIPLIEETAQQQIVVSAMDIESQASTAFAKCKEIYDKCQGPGYDIQIFALKSAAPRGEYADPAVLYARRSRYMGEQMGQQTRYACEQSLQCRYSEGP
jgi:hypothetical protein